MKGPGAEAARHRRHVRRRPSVCQRRRFGPPRHADGDQGAQRQGRRSGRKMDWIHIDTETNPATGSRVAATFPPVRLALQVRQESALSLV